MSQQERSEVSLSLEWSLLLLVFLMSDAKTLSCFKSDLLSSSVEKQDCHVCSLSLRLLETHRKFSVVTLAFFSTFFSSLLITREDESFIVSCKQGLLKFYHILFKTD